MGRVSKYKKIKSFDPYSKKNRGNIDLSQVGVWGLGDNGQKSKKRSRRSEILRKNKGKKRRNNENDGFDLPPSGKDEFDIADLVGSVKKQKIETLNDDPTDHSEIKIAVEGNVATIPKTMEDEKKVAKLLKVETKLKEEEKKEKIQAQSRMEGESKNAYNRRSMNETRQIIKQTKMEKNVEKRKRKKEFHNNKKRNKKKKVTMYEDESDSEDIIVQKRKHGVTSESDYVQFGEQAERPPTFKQLPRGARQKDESSKKKGKSTGMTDVQIEAEKNAMEMMRRKVQAQYASIKAKRKRAGEFHL